VCLAKVLARFAGRLLSGSSPARFDVIGVMRQPDECDRDSASATGNGDVPNARFGLRVRGNLAAFDEQNGSRVTTGTLDWPARFLTAG
jgi:hypothetical protein